jgi:4-aminobutyrate aminotransferase
MRRIMNSIPGIKATSVIDSITNTSYNSTYTYPLVIKTGKGCMLEDIDGNKFLDFTSNIGSCPLGYSHPAVIEMLKKYSTNGAHKIAGQDFYCEEHAQLALKLLSICPPNTKTFFINSGAEAVENAIKLAYKKMGALPGVSCINAFHGRTLGALTFTFSKEVQKANFPELQVKRIKFCTADNDDEIDALENLLKQYKVAFVISEVIQGEGGLNVGSKKFVSNLRKMTKQYGVPLVIDEVQSGMGRTGNWWAYENYGIQPDMMTVAKGLQVGAVVYDRNYDPKDHGVLSSTWGAGSRIDMAVGMKIIETIETELLLENAKKMGEKLLNGISEVIGQGDVVDVRGIGLMIGVELGQNSHRNEIVNALFRKGLLVLPSGNRAIRIMPPLIITEEEVTNGLSVLIDVFSKSQE